MPGIPWTEQDKPPIKILCNHTLENFNNLLGVLKIGAGIDNPAGGLWVSGQKPVATTFRP